MKLGASFSDSLILESKSGKHKIRDNDPSWWVGAGRALIIATLFFLAFFILMIRLFDLTLVKGFNYRRLADSNRTRELIRHAPRGNLLDRTGKLLTTNVPFYRLIKPCDQGSGDCNETITRDDGDKLLKNGLPKGWFLETDFRRLYPLGATLSHILGYTGELSADELKVNYYSIRNYKPSDRVGRMGAELTYEEKLRGKDGKELVEVDATGKILRTLGRETEIAGENITLSIDATLSTVAEKAFPPGLKGAVIVTKPSTGEILVLYSSPTFDPNQFSLGMSQSSYQALTTNPDQPLFDRAIGGVYPPGSTFKIVMAMAALEEKVIDANTIVEDNGVITMGPYTFPNWYFIQYGKTEGLVNIVRALKRSNDIFFYKTGEFLGVTKIDSWARKVGLGKALGIELSGEAGGLVPDPAWKNQHFQSPSDIASRNNLWYLGDTYHLSIGQGYLLTTPLQVNMWTNIIAAGGKLCTPTIEKISGLNKPNCRDLGIKKTNLELIVEGMKEACAAGGTGWPLFDFSVNKSANNSNSPEASNSAAASKLYVPVACKTGTAEFGDPRNRTHAWFTAFAPVPTDTITSDGTSDPQKLSGNPEISVTVLVEEGGEGSDVAAPIAKKIFEEWFSR